MKRFILVFLAVLILCGCTAPTPSLTVENTPTASQTVTPTVTPTQTVENSPSPTKTPTPKPTGTPSGFNAHTEFKNGSGSLELDYSIYVPDNYDQSKEYPHPQEDLPHQADRGQRGTHHRVGGHRCQLYGHDQLLRVRTHQDRLR